MSVIGYVSDPAELATVDGREYRKPADGVAVRADGFGTTRSTIIRNPGDIPVSRATFGAGKMGRTAGMSAISAPNTHASGDLMARMMRKDKRSRRVTTRTIPGFVQTPEMLARIAERAAMRKAA